MSQKHQRKDRKCEHCQKVLVMTAKEIKAHAVDCGRFTRLGLIMPGGVQLR